MDGFQVALILALLVGFVITVCATAPMLAIFGGIAAGLFQGLA